MEYASKQNRLHWLPHWQREIIARYPLVYLEPTPERVMYYAKFPERRPEDYCNLRYGFECLEGWAGLIEELSATATDLVKALRAFGFQYDASISACVCKEKLGTLRWQGDDNLLPPFRTLWLSYTAHIQQRSSNTCEVSGKFGELRDVGGWFMTLSDTEFEKELLRRAKRQSGRESDAGGGEAAK